MAGSVTPQITFETLPGPIPLQYLDTNFTQLSTSINSLNNYSNYYQDTGSVNTIVVTVPSPQAVTISAGLQLYVKVAVTNTGPVTLNVNGLGSFPVVSSTGSTLTASEILAGTIIEVIYNGSSWQISGLTNITSAAPYYAQTAAEVSAGITPSNYSYPSGNVLRYGADPTGTNDSTTAIQNAVNVAIYFTSSSTSGSAVVTLPAGTYKTSDTIQLGYGVNPQYTSVKFQGVLPNFGGATGQNGTIINFTANDRPAINVQGARYTYIENITINGVYNYIISNNLGYAVNINDLNQSTWQDPTFPTNSFSNNAPYAGITIDAYSLSAPSPAYPNVSYPSFLGSVSQYGKAYSSGVILNNVFINNFVVGLVRPNANSNGEFIHYREGIVSGCVIGVCLPHEQSRCLELTNINFSQCYSGINNAAFGFNQGQSGGTYQNLHFGGCINMIEVPGGYGTSVTLRNCYAETTARIGEVSGTGNVPVLTLDCCTITFREEDLRYGVPLNHCSSSNVKLALINGTQITTAFGLIVGGTSVGPNVYLSDSIIWALIADQGSPAMPTNFVQGSGGILGYNISVSGFGNMQSSGTIAPYGAFSYLPWFFRGTSLGFNSGTGFGNSSFNYCPSVYYGSYAGTNVTLINRSGTSVELPGGRYNYSPGGGPIKLDVGDYLNIGGAFFVVTSFNGSNCVLTQITGYRLDSSGNFTNLSSSDSTNAPINGWFITRLYVAYQNIAGTITSGSPTITNVKNIGNDGNQWNSTNISANDWATFQDIAFANVGGNAISASKQVSSINVSAQTITFSSNFSLSKSAIYLPFWIKTLNNTP